MSINYVVKFQGKWETHQMDSDGFLCIMRMYRFAVQRDDGRCIERNDRERFDACGRAV